jgi:hypothetical protein
LFLISSSLQISAKKLQVCIIILDETVKGDPRSFTEPRTAVSTGGTAAIDCQQMVGCSIQALANSDFVIGKQFS